MDAQTAAAARRAEAQVWQQNVSPRFGLVHPSRAYAGVWLRDSFWTLTALGNVRISQRALQNFAAHQRASGQIPTQFSYFLDVPIYRPDESTLLFLIWSYWQAHADGHGPSRTVLRRALTYARSHVVHGLYQSSPGPYASWFDSYRLSRADTLAYNQGLYVDALLAARALGLPLQRGEIRAAQRGYDSLASGGYLRFSLHEPNHDISGLAGEFLALWLFHTPLLANTVVAHTLSSQPSFQGGYLVVTDPHGQYLSQHDFVMPMNPGDYQNGASWLLYDALALATGFLQGVSGTLARLDTRLRVEFHTGAVFHEFLDTNPAAPDYLTEPGWRDGFAWDSFLAVIDRLIPSACSEQPARAATAGAAPFRTYAQPRVSGAATDVTLNEYSGF
jgi:hypothetical protein